VGIVRKDLPRKVLAQSFGDSPPWPTSSPPDSVLQFQCAMNPASFVSVSDSLAPHTPTSIPPLSIPIRRPPPKPSATAAPVIAPSTPDAPTLPVSDAKNTPVSSRTPVSAASPEKIVSKDAPAALKPPRRDVDRIQQLRGIFAAYDSNHDGCLSKRWACRVSWCQSTLTTGFDAVVVSCVTPSSQSA
jgi:hypothetical protein